MFSNRRKTAASLSTESNDIAKVFTRTIDNFNRISEEAEQEASDREELAKQHLEEAAALKKVSRVNKKRANKLSEVFNISDDEENDTDSNETEITPSTEKLMAQEGGN